jgi:AGZA family xanthine/uracil permease-like MFS transporter
LAAAVGSLVMALYANLPFGLALGMGLNAYFAFTVVIALGIPWQTAFAAVFVEGIIFIPMSSIGARQCTVGFFPDPVKFAIGAGIGPFLLLLDLIEINVAVVDDATLVSLGSIASDPVALLALAGVGFTIFLYAKGVTGSIILGILTTAAAGWGLTFAGVVNGGVLTPESIPLLQYDITPLVGAFLDGFQNIEPVSLVIVVFTFFFVDFFDTAGTLIGVSQFGDFLDEDGNLPNMEQPLMADAIATTFGAIVGTTTVTTYVESATGIEQEPH